MRIQGWQQLIFDSMTNGVIAVDLDERITQINRSACRLLERNEEEILGHTLVELGARPLKGSASSALSTAFATGEAQIGFVGAWELQGRTVYVRSNANLLEDVNGQLVGAVAVFEDISETQILSERLRHAERLALLGEFAAQLVHEIRNPLSTLFGALELLEEAIAEPHKELKGQQDMQEVLHAARTQVMDMNRLLGHMLDLSRPDTGSRTERVDIGPLLAEVVLLIKPQARRTGIEIDNRWQEGEIIVLGAASELRQVFFNLVLNSVEAMNRGGTVILDGSVTEDGVEIRICDTGPGIPANAVDKVTQAFFTTKAEGTGLGLTVVNRILDAHHGSLDVQSTEAGTKAIVRLPCSGSVSVP